MTLTLPEIVPFRLTPSMLDAMGISGYEGVFRRVSEATMRTLRAHKDLLLSVLETFIHDPLVEWQRAPRPIAPAGAGGALVGAAPAGAEEAQGEQENRDGLRMRKRISERLEGIYNSGTEEQRRERARRAAKDGGPAAAAAAAAAAPPNAALEVRGQVARLLKEATDEANLCLLYIGWMPFL